MALSKFDFKCLIAKHLKGHFYPVRANSSHWLFALSSQHDLLVIG